MTSAQRLILMAAAGSALLLAGAFVFQALGYAPCKMCYWQRYPHAIAAGIGVLFLMVKWRVLPWLGALAAAVTGGIGAFHVGVEQKWWPGPSSCSGGGAGLGDLGGSDLLSTDVIDKVVMCDEISWQLLGISMPGWNALFSFALVVVWIMAARRAA
ncbi:MAG: disulfide bond formation protein B [Pseudomonadota bacterium]